VHQNQKSYKNVTIFSFLCQCSKVCVATYYPIRCDGSQLCFQTTVTHMGSVKSKPWVKGKIMQGWKRFELNSKGIYKTQSKPGALILNIWQRTSNLIPFFLSQGEKVTFQWFKKYFPSHPLHVQGSYNDTQSIDSSSSSTTIHSYINCLQQFKQLNWIELKFISH
jgi:hypothetical protein